MQRGCECVHTVLGLWYSVINHTAMKECIRVVMHKWNYDASQPNASRCVRWRHYFIDQSLLTLETWCGYDRSLSNLHWSMLHNVCLNNTMFVYRYFFHPPPRKSQRTTNSTAHSAPIQNLSWQANTDWRRHKVRICWHLILITTVAHIKSGRIAEAKKSRFQTIKLYLTWGGDRIPHKKTVKRGLFELRDV